MTDPDHTAAFFIRGIYNVNVQKIFTCAINAVPEISLLSADTSKGSFGVIAYGAAVTVVFSCCTLVYVCKTGCATIQFAFFSNRKPNIMARHNVIYIEAWCARDIPLGLACTRHGFDTSISLANQV